MHIRPATAADRPVLEAFARAALAERDYAALVGPVDWPRLSLTDASVAFLACDPNPIGCFIAALVEHPLSGLPYADQVLWYVTPACRRTRASLRLLGAIEDFCLTQGVTRLRLVQPVARPRMARALRHAGYDPVETGWVRVLTP